MRRYKNVSGHSGVIAFESRPEAIVVEFQDGWKYEYTDDSSGVLAVRKMKRLADAGEGLSTFISQVVRDTYARKFH